MISCLFVDDEPSAIEVLEIHAQKLKNLKVLGRFTNPFEARDFLKNNLVDLIFLDINMPGLSGLQLLDQLSHHPLIVFTTAYSEYAVNSYDYKAVDYLLKPIEFDRFKRAINRVAELMELKSQNGTGSKEFLFLKDGYKQVKVSLVEIQYIQSDGNYLNVFSASGRVNTRMTLSQMLDLLPQHFIRVHNSYIINIEQIESIQNNQIHLPDGQVSIGPQYRELFLSKISQ